MSPLKNERQTMKRAVPKLKTPIAAVAVAFACAAFADTETVGGVEWNYSVVSGEARIYAGDKTAAIPTNTAGNVTVPDTLGGCPVTSIGSWAFYNCNRLMKVSMHVGVTTIEDNAFNGCSLVNVEIPAGVTTIGAYAFFQSGLERVWLPNSLTSIGTAAFASCPFLMSADITSTLTSLPSQLFSGCTALVSVTMPDYVTDIGAQTFKDCTALKEIALPDGVTSIEGSAFTGSALEVVYVSEGKTESVKAAGLDPAVGGFKIYESGTVTTCMEGEFTWYYRPVGEAGGIKTAEIVGNIPAIAPLPIGDLTVPSTLDGLTVTRLGEWAFSGCDKMTSVTIPATVTHIGEAAFNECDALTSVVIPDGVTEIGPSAFNECDALEAVKIGTGVTRIGSGAFFYCTALKGAVIPDGVTHVGNSAFSGCSALESVEIGAGVTRIGDSVFKECDALKSVAIPVGVATIGENAFYGCDVLQSVAIGAGVTRIGDGAFGSCGSLKSVTIPDSVRMIGEEAFSSCSALESVAIPASVTYIGPSAFDSTPADMKVYVATGKSDAVNDLLVASGLDTSAIGYSEKFTVDFDANGGEPALISRLAVADVVGELPTPTLAGYTLVGWFMDVKGGTPIDAATPVTGNVTYYAHWLIEGYVTETVEGVEWGYRIVDGTAEVYDLPSAPAGAVTVPATLGGKAVTRIGGNAFDGCGSLEEITIPKSVVNILTNAFTGTALATVHVEKGDTARVSALLAASGYDVDKVTFVEPEDDPDPATPDPVTPEPTPSETTPSETTPSETTPPDTTSSDSVSPQSTPSGVSAFVPLSADDITAPYAAAQTLYGAVYDGLDVVGVVELKLGKVSAKKNASKVSGSVTLLDGKKYNVKGVQAVVGAAAPLTVTLEVKKVGTMAVTIGGDRFAGSLGKWHMQTAIVGGNWKSSAVTVSLETADLSTIPGTVLESLLPYAEKGTSSGNKWSFAKAAGVKWTKPKAGEGPVVLDAASGKGLVVDTSKGKTNLSGMKLTYTAKKGTFKGSFKVYALESSGTATKLKKYSMKVGGVVVNGVGYGEVTCKRPSITWSLTVK